MEEQHAWLVRPTIDGTDCIDIFREMDIIATKVPGTEVDIEGSSTNLVGKSEEEIRTILSQPPYNLTGRLLGNTVPQLDRFVNGMNEGDLVLVPDGDTVHFASIESKLYCFDTTPIADSNIWLPYWRKVQWLISTSRDFLSSDLRKLLMNRRQIGDLSKLYDEIAALGKGESNGVKSQNVQFMYPLRPTFTTKISLTVPSDITHTEAKRLGHLVENTFFEGDYES